MVSATASNPPPIIPGFSVGDIITIVFTKSTNGPSLGTTALRMVRGSTRYNRDYILLSIFLL